MEYTKLGRTGLDVSRICLDCMSYGGGNLGNQAWSLPEEESRPFISSNGSRRSFQNTRSRKPERPEAAGPILTQVADRNLTRASGSPGGSFNQPSMVTGVT
jgi:hypothetical protein